MRLLILLMILFPVLGIAQTKEEAEKTMKKYVDYYNNREHDKMCSELFGRQGEDCFWNSVLKHVDPYKEYGKILSYTYHGKVTQDPEKVTVFKVVYEKNGVRAMSFNFTEKKKFGTYRFATSDEEIEGMLANAE